MPPLLLLLALQHSLNLTDITCDICVESSKGISHVLNHIISNQDFYMESCFEIHGEYSSSCYFLRSYYESNFFGAVDDRYFNSTYFCEEVLELCPNEGWNKYDSDEFINEIISTKPPPIDPSLIGNPRYKVLQIADLHMDDLYTTGAPTSCSGETCCQYIDGNISNSSKSAGYWGSVAKCDIPIRTFEQFVKFVNTTLIENIDFILWTGDTSPHDYNISSFGEDYKYSELASQYFDEYFPGVPIYGQLGNHDCYPDHNCPTNPRQDQYVLRNYSELFKKSLPFESLMQFETKGYYSVILHDKKLIIIMVNSGLYDSMNYHLIDDSEHPREQLKFIIKELKKAEDLNYSAIISGHLPYGDQSALHQWGIRYRAVVDRFQNIIKAQIFGHVHEDEIIPVSGYSTNGSAVGYTLVAPSLTTYFNLNPSFRVLEFETDSNILVDYTQYRLNLTYWNNYPSGPLVWDIAYTFTEFYGLPNTSINTVANLINDVRASNQTVLNKYIWNYYASTKEIGSYIASQSQIHNMQCATLDDIYAYMNCANVTQSQYSKNNEVVGPWVYFSAE